MDLKPFKEDTDLHRFYEFINHINSTSIEIVEEDWDNMCGISIIQTYDINDKCNAKMCFNFYSDGSFRCMIDDRNA